MNWTNKLAALPLLALSQGLFAAEAITLNAAELDRVTAGRFLLFDNIATVVTNSANAARLHLDDLIALRLGEVLQAAPAGAAQVTAPQTTSSQLVWFEQMNGNMQVMTRQLKPGESFTFQQLFGAAEPLSGNQRSINGATSITTLKPGEPVWIRQVNAQGILYTYVGNSGTATLKLR